MSKSGAMHSQKRDAADAIETEQALRCGKGPAEVQVREPLAWSTPNRNDYWFGFEFELEFVLFNELAPEP